MVLGGEHNQQVIILPTVNIVHTCLYVMVVKDVYDIPRSFCNKKQAKQDLQRNPMCLTYSDNDYILE